MNQQQFVERYEKLSLDIGELERQRADLLVTYRESLGMTAKERTRIVAAFWPDKIEILRRTGLSITGIRATASHLGLSSRPRERGRKTLGISTYMHKLVSDPE